MNQGIFGFPSPTPSSSIISIAEFDSSGTYTIPSDASEIEILLVGGGGGGGGGGRVAGTPATLSSGGGAGGGGGGIVYQKIQTKDLVGRYNLNISIGSGGAGGLGRAQAITLNTNQTGQVGSPGSNSTITITNYSGFLIHAIGGAGGAAGTVPIATGAVLGGVARSSLIGAIVANESGGAGSFSVEVTPVIYSSFRSNGGAGGGSANSTTTCFPGGSIILQSLTTANPIGLNLLYAGGVAGTTLDGITASFGGVINGGTLGTGKGQDGSLMYKTSAGHYLFGGFGGAGGGGANSVGAGNGGDGYRGGGGGGGGGVRTATALNANEVPSGAGGRGGNGYCRIIARR